jgi:transcriptional activator of cad operon
MSAMTPFRVGPWIVEPQAGEISRADAPREAAEVRRLGPKVTAVLVCLAERAGQVVSKNQLIAHAWDGAPFTSDEALAAVLYELRKALDDDARKPRFVETLRGSGYRWIAPVEPLEARVPEGDPSAASPSVEHPGRARRLWLLAGLASLVGVVAFTAVLLWRAPGASPSEPAEIRSLAVLPVTTFTPGAPVSSGSADPLSAALTDMLTADLAQLCPQDVTPGIAMRGQAILEPDGRWRLDQVVDVLGVDAVVEGSVLRSGDRLWISLQLVETATGRMLWNGSWDRDLGDELLVLREVALEAARKIRGTLGEAPDEAPDEAR